MHQTSSFEFSVDALEPQANRCAMSVHIYFLLLYFSLFLSIFFVPFLFIFAFCFLLGIVCFSMVLYTYASILGSSFAFMFLIVVTFET